MEIKRIAVLGAGIMGNGIAQVAALSGFRVTLYDIQQEFLDRATDSITSSLDRMIKKDKITPAQAQEVKAGISTTLELGQACDGVDMVIEAIPELLDMKKRMFSEVDVQAPEHAILATNTSNLSVTEMATATRRPESFIGMHWFNPPVVMKLIEIVTGLQTSEQTLAITRQVSEKMGKTTVVCKDSQGFITSRALTAFLVECYRIHEEGLASAEDIDEAIRLGLNHPMGPLQLTDHIGLDTIMHVSQDLVSAFGERFLVPQSVINMVRAGRSGVKAGRGFYKHDSCDGT